MSWIVCDGIWWEWGKTRWAGGCAGMTFGRDVISWACRTLEDCGDLGSCQRCGWEWGRIHNGSSWPCKPWSSPPASSSPWPGSRRVDGYSVLAECRCLHWSTPAGHCLDLHTHCRLPLQNSKSGLPPACLSSHLHLPPASPLCCSTCCRFNSHPLCSSTPFQILLLILSVFAGCLHIVWGWNCLFLDRSNLFPCLIK